MLVTARIEELFPAIDMVTMEQCSSMTPRPKSLRLAEKFLQRSRVNHEESVDIEHPVRVDEIANPKWKHGQLCWEAKGKCAQDFKSMEMKLLEELGQSRRESFCEVGISLFMIGKTSRNAKPMIIVSSEDKTSRTEAKKAIIKSGILTHSNFEIGVLKYLPSGPIHPVAGSRGSSSSTAVSIPHRLNSTGRDPSGVAASSLAYYSPEQQHRITGMPIYVKTASKGSRMATANLVYKKSAYGYLTAAHVFSPWDQDLPSVDDGDEDLYIPFDSDSDDEDGEDDCDKKISYAGSLVSRLSKAKEFLVSHNASIRLRGLMKPALSRDSAGAPGDLPSNLILLGHLDSGREPEKSLDYAIIAIEDYELRRRLVNSRASRGMGDAHASPARSKPSLATAWTNHGPVYGTVNNVPILMRLPGSISFQSVYTFAYKGVIMQGDCGSLLLDTTSKAIYGMIIAAADWQNVAYIIDAKELMDHIANAGWHLVDVDDDYMNSSEVHEEAPRSPSEHSPRTKRATHNFRNINQRPRPEDTLINEYDRKYNTPLVMVY